MYYVFIKPVKYELLAGVVIGSLEILGNPTGLIRNIGTGVSDLFRMPYEGLTRGPGAFIGGVSRGMASLLKHISTGRGWSVWHTVYQG